MPILLYCVGAIVFAMGAAAIGYGIPINEFSFGNTLIVSGTVFAAGGLVVLALGVVVSRVQQLAEALARGAPMRLGQAEMPVPMRAAVQPAPARAPFPPKPKPASRPDAVVTEPVPPTPEPAAADVRPEAPPPSRPFAMPPLPKPPLSKHPPREPEDLAAVVSPALPNPESDSASEADEAPLPGPRAEKPAVEFAPSFAGLAADEEASIAQAEAEEPEVGTAGPAGRERRRFEPLGPEPFKASPFGRAAEPFRAPEPEKAESGLFDAMWPAPKPGDVGPLKPRETASADLTAASDRPAETDQPAEKAEAAGEPAHEEPRAVAILKSGVVDGMGYTLYVDGSIEAELPQGTLRFASINELRAHLEKSS